MRVDMNNSRACEQCGVTVIGRSNKRHCSPECKKLTKAAYDKGRYDEDPEPQIARAKAHYWADTTRKQAYDVGYRQGATPERKAARALSEGRYARANPENGARRQRLRRAAKAGNGVFVVTPRDYQRCLDRHNNACAYCAGGFTAANPLEWDHVTPVCRGGVHGISNLVPSCRACNRNKSIRLLTEWRFGRVVTKQSLAVL